MCKYFIYIIALYLGLFLSETALAADVNLYICQKNGETFLQDSKPMNCDTLKTYTYHSVKNTSPIANSPPRIYQDDNRNDQTNDALAQQEQDDYYKNQCFFYDSKIKNEMLEMSRRPEDDLEVRQIIAQIPKDKAQYQYYCGKPY